MTEFSGGVSVNTEANSRESSLGKIVHSLAKFARNSERTAGHVLLSAFASIVYQTFEKGFHLENAIRTADGPIIEVGGPTDQNWYLGDIKNSQRKMFISNLTSGHPIHPIKETDKEAPVKYDGKVDFRADATNLPFADESVGVLFASCLPRDIRHGMLEEAKRVLKDSSILIASGMVEDDMRDAEQLGFRQVEHIRYQGLLSRKSRYDVVFRKSNEESSN